MSKYPKVVRHPHHKALKWMDKMGLRPGDGIALTSKRIYVGASPSYDVRQQTENKSCAMITWLYENSNVVSNALLVYLGPYKEGRHWVYVPDHGPCLFHRKELEKLLGGKSG